MPNPANGAESNQALSARLPELIESLATVSGVEISRSDGEVVYHQGECTTDVFLVIRGYVKFTRINADGNATITAILDAGQLFGGRLNPEAASAHTAVAKCELILRRYSGEQFARMLAEQPLLAGQVITMLGYRQELLERRLQAVLHSDVRSRIGMILNDLTTHYGGRCGHGHEVDIPLTQQELAELVGASRPVVSSRLNELRRQGVLDYSRSYICVDNLAALNTMAAEAL